jgi:hypothetical protein
MNMTNLMPDEQLHIVSGLFQGPMQQTGFKLVGNVGVQSTSNEYAKEMRKFWELVGDQGQQGESRKWIPTFIQCIENDKDWACDVGFSSPEWIQH